MFRLPSFYISQVVTGDGALSTRHYSRFIRGNVLGFAKGIFLPIIIRTPTLRRDKCTYSQHRKERNVARFLHLLGTAV